ncbi:DUF6449 domain-containing protein [Blautia sp. MSJ-19]|uniref:DUF6449 domain-containing protein n=1 Tax=Blautia sp. MSJ-19 TaxID=2841517 RepID=UPI001C0F0594|nr:DUF6449 domain-containing protein [Blautia sp. MSJ-19]MBU5479975.1 ABC transporter permease [Blautia sp. MSJ-19]
MRSRIFSSKHIKTITKGQEWIPAFLTLGFLLAFPVAALVKLGTWRTMGYTSAEISVLYAHLWKDGLVMTGMVVAVIAALMNSINEFIYLYSGKKTDFYHGLPMKRSEMFTERVVTGLIYYIVPYVVMEFFMICIGATRGFFSLKIMGMAVRMFGMHLLIYLVIYFSIVLIICVTGNMLMGILCLMGMYLYGIAMNMLMLSYGTAFLQTFAGDRRYGIFRFLINYASPGTLVLSMLNEYAYGNAGKLIAAIAILTVVLALLSWQAYVRRPSEAAGRSMVYRWIAVLVKFMVVVPTGLGVGWIFYTFTTGKSGMIWWIFGLILGTVVSHGLIETIYHMSFQKFFARKIQIVIAGVLVACCALIYQKDLLHFDSYIPKQEEIASVNINTSAFDQDYYEAVDKTDDGKFFNFVDNNKWDDARMAFSGENGIGDQTYAALKNIVNSSCKEAEINERVYSYFTCVKYTLKSGRVIYRNYWAGEYLKPLMSGLYEEENLKKMKFSLLDIDEKYLNSLYLTDAGGNGYRIFQNDESKMSELMEAMRKDVEEASTDDFLHAPEVRIDFEYKLPVKRSVAAMIPGESEESSNYVDWVLGIYPSFKNTLAILKETGYPLTIDELKINKITLNYNYGDINETPAEEVTYEKPEEIEALQKAMVVKFSGYFGDDAEVSTNIDVSAYTEQGEVMNVFGLKLSELPDFVQDKLDELGITQNSVQIAEPMVSDETVTDDYVEDYYEDDNDDIASQAIIGGADEPTSISLE